MTARPGKLDKAHRLLTPRTGYLIGTRSSDGEANLIPVSNLTSVSTDPEQIIIAVHKKWKTLENLTDTDGFTVSVPTIDQLDGVWKLAARYSGYRSASRSDKLASCGLAIDTEACAFGPVLTDGMGWMSCRIVHRTDFGGDHGVVVGQVEAVWFDNLTFQEDGTPLIDLRPAMQITGNLFTTAGEATTIPFFP